MSDQIATRYGVLGRALSVAVLQTIVLTARDSVNGLNDICRRLALMDVLPPGCNGPVLGRWQELLGNLFPTEILVVDSSGSPSLDLLDLPATEAEERAIRRLLTAAASFLLAESAMLDEIVDTGQGPHGTEPWDASLIQAILDQARSASEASDLLLDHAEAGTWRGLLATYRTTAATAVSAADVLARDQEFPPVVVSFDDSEPTLQPGGDEPYYWVGHSSTGQRSVAMRVVFVTGLSDQGKSQFVRTLKQVALDREGAPWSALFLFTGTLRAISDPAVDATLRERLLGQLRHELGQIDWPDGGQWLPWRALIDNELLVHRVNYFTARIADLQRRVDPDIAPAVGIAFRPLIAEPPERVKPQANVPQRSEDRVSLLVQELKELRRGRGICASDLITRIGPRLRRAWSIDDHDASAVVRARVRLELTRLCQQLPDDLRTSASVALALRDDASGEFLDRRIAWLAEHFDRDPRTARRGVDVALRHLAVLLAQGDDPHSGVHGKRYRFVGPLVVRHRSVHVSYQGPSPTWWFRASDATIFAVTVQAGRGSIAWRRCENDIRDIIVSGLHGSGLTADVKRAPGADPEFFSVGPANDDAFTHAVLTEVIPRLSAFLTENEPGDEVQLWAALHSDDGMHDVRHGHDESLDPLQVAGGLLEARFDTTRHRSMAGQVLLAASSSIYSQLTQLGIEIADYERAARSRDGMLLTYEPAEWLSTEVDPTDGSRPGVDLLSSGDPG